MDIPDRCRSVQGRHPSHAPAHLNFDAQLLRPPAHELKARRPACLRIVPPAARGTSSASHAQGALRHAPAGPGMRAGRLPRGSVHAVQQPAHAQAFLTASGAAGREVTRALAAGAGRRGRGLQPDAGGRGGRPAGRPALLRRPGGLQVATVMHLRSSQTLTQFLGWKNTYRKTLNKTLNPEDATKEA